MNTKLSPYRSRIYESYVTARQESLAPSDITGLRPRAPYLCRMITDHFPENKDARILDLGCGHGAIVHFAQQLGYRNIRGVDGSPEQVEAARKLGVTGVEQGNLFEVLAACPAGSIDCVVMFDVIEHFNRDELIGLIDEVKRVLADNGRWIIHVPNGESPFGGRMRYWDVTHELAFTSTSISQLLYASGFSQVRAFEDAPVIHGAASAVRWLLWKGIRALLRLYIAAETGDSAKRAVFSQNLLAVAVR